MDDVMVTGATGFVGGRLAERLLEEGYDLRLLVRTPSKAKSLEERGAELVEGDLTDEASIRRAMEGVDGVFHLAAIYELGGDREWMREVNVEGTRRVLDVADELGVERVVYCGSDTSLGDTDGEICDESKTHDGDFRSVYAETKHEAHELVEERIEEGAPVVNAIVSTVYGPGDDSPVADLLEHHLAGRMVALLDREAGYTFTHVDDVASALQLCYEKGDPGERYLVSGTPATFDQFFEQLSDLTGIAEPKVEVPDWLIDVASPVAERVAGLAGASRAEVRESISMGRNVTRFFSGAKLCDELGWEPRTLEEGLRDTLPSFGRQEYERAMDLLRAAKWPLAGLAVFDIALGGTALLAPDLYLQIIHGAADDPTYLVRRTGVLWLVFALAQGWAAIDPEERAGWVMAVGVLRLMDVPADPVYLASSEELTVLGTLGLASAPLANLVAGGFMLYAGYRGLRARRWESAEHLV